MILVDAPLAIVELLGKSFLFSIVSLTVFWIARRRVSAAMQSQLLRITLGGLLIMAVVGLAQPIWHLDLGPQKSASVTSTGGYSFEANQPAATIAPTVANFEATAIVGGSNKSSWFVTVWGIGTAICFGAFLVHWLRALHLRKNAEYLPGAELDSRTKVMMHPSVKAPMSFGVINPRIFLPAEHTTWSNTERDMVLAHELAHVRRWDAAAIWVAELCRAVFWMNPFVWIMVHHLRLADEHAADDEVIGAGSSPVEYAEWLAQLARRAAGTPTFSAASAMAQPSTVRRRVECILDVRQERRTPRLRTVVLVGMASAAGATLIGGATTAKAQARKAEVQNEARKVKVEHIVVEAVQFEKATLEEAVHFLRIKSGVPFKIEAKSKHLITMNLTRIPLGVAVNAVTDLAGVGYKIEDNKFVITPKNEGSPDPNAVGINETFTVPIPEDTLKDLALMRKKLKEIILPSIQFEGASVEDALTWLRTQSREHDKIEPDKERRGINIVLKKQSAPPPNISLKMQHVPLGAALKAITELADLQYRVEPFAVVVVPKVHQTTDLYTRVFKVPADFASEEASAELFLQKNGVTLPDGSAIFHNKPKSQLIIRTTAGSMDRIAELLQN